MPRRFSGCVDATAEHVGDRQLAETLRAFKREFVHNSAEKTAKL